VRRGLVQELVTLTSYCTSPYAGTIDGARVVHRTIDSARISSLTVAGPRGRACRAEYSSCRDLGR